MLRYQEIKGMILDRISVTRPKERLPSRLELCRVLDTNRATLDKAINELISEGLLSAKKGSGTYVVGLSDSTLGQSGNWGVIVPNVMENIYPGLVRGAENVAQQYNANIILCNSDNNADKQEQYIKRLIASGVSGFIIVPVISNNIKENFQLFNQLTEASIPFVFCNRGVDGINAPIVTSNDFYGGYIATRHLIQHGYRNIAYVSEIKYKTSIDRCQGYISALIENGLEINRQLLVIGGEPGLKTGIGAEIRTILESNEPVDAVFCFNDYLAQKVCRVVESMGLKISQDIGIIGYDNTDICEQVETKLTSVSYKNLEIGERAASLLWKMINHQPLHNFEYYLFQPEIVVRDSCQGRMV